MLPNMEEQTIQEKETLKETAEQLFRHTGDYLETLYKKVLLELTQKGVNAGAIIINSLTAVLLGFFVLFFLGFGLAWWMGDLVNSRAGGFFIVGGFFLLLMMIIMASGRSIISSIRNRLIKKIYDNNSHIQ